VFYDYDSYDVSAQYQQVLQADVRFLRQHQSMKFTRPLGSSAGW
jgi:hypothetical protein